MNETERKKNEFTFFFFRVSKQVIFAFDLNMMENLNLDNNFQLFIA